MNLSMQLIASKERGLSGLNDWTSQTYVTGEKSVVSPKDFLRGQIFFLNCASIKCI